MGRVGVAEELVARGAHGPGIVEGLEGSLCARCCPFHPSVGSGWGAGDRSGSSKATERPPVLGFPLALSSSLTCKTAVSSLPAPARPPPSTGWPRVVAFRSGLHRSPKPVRKA